MEPGGNSNQTHNLLSMILNILGYKKSYDINNNPIDNSEPVIRGSLIGSGVVNIPECRSYSIVCYGSSISVGGVSVPSGYSQEASGPGLIGTLSGFSVVGGSDSEIYYSYLS